MKKTQTLFFLLLLSQIGLFAQEVTQTVRGVIVDKQAGIPLQGVNVVLLGSEPKVGTATDENGEFVIKKVPVGRQGIATFYVGYKPIVIRNLQIISGKETVLTLELEEQIITVDEVKVKAYRNDETINDMSLVSSRSFSIEETEKYAGSWGDPARMASNFAGVMPGGSQVNDIVIRGNSPNGLLWKLDGVNIPNPNHFGALGTTGGPVGMLNNNVLNNSDFFTGAFPAGYGNALSGVFDLKMRSGNKFKREYLGQVGFNGFELGAEGPFVEGKNASYIINYRYSTLGLIDNMGLDLKVGAVPYYQDVNFKINMPTKSAGLFSIFGLGGLSYIDFADDEETKRKEGTHFTSDMGVVGLTHRYFFNEKMSIYSVLSVSGTRTTTCDSVFEERKMKSWYGEKSSEIRTIFATTYRNKLNSRNTLEAGINLENISVNYLDSFYLKEYQQFEHLKDVKEQIKLLQTHINWMHVFSDQLTTTVGLHYQQADINKNSTIEPRIGARWKPTASQSINIGYGLHSQLQPRQIYFTDILVDSANSDYSQANRDLGFTKSMHFVAGYDNMLNPNLRFRVETYYQYLYDVPINELVGYESVINYGSSFFLNRYGELHNGGTASNYGVDITFEKFLHKNFYYMLTTSIFESKYKGSDGIERNTVFNGNYVVNLLGGYEFIIKNKNALSVDLKAVRAGGLRMIPIDLDASIEAGETVRDYSDPYKDRYDGFFRLDLRVAFKLNGRKISQEWALDIQNLTNHQNRFYEYYDPEKQTIEETSQMSLMPMMMWRIRF